MPQKCVYDVPMARNLSMVTLGLDPNQALLRNMQHLADSRRFTLKSMPVQSFVDTFMPAQELCDDHMRYRSHKHAFNTVPAAARTSEEIYLPLVSYQQHGCGSLRSTCIGCRSQPEYDLQVPMSRLCLRGCCLAESASASFRLYEASCVLLHERFLEDCARMRVVFSLRVWPRRTILRGQAKSCTRFLQ